GQAHVVADRALEPLDGAVDAFARPAVARGRRSGTRCARAGLGHRVRSRGDRDLVDLEARRGARLDQPAQRPPSRQRREHRAREVAAPTPARVADLGEHGLLEVEDEAAIPAGVRVRDLVRLAGIAEEQEVVREELLLVPAAEGEATRADDRQRWPRELLDTRPFALLGLTAVLEDANAAHRALVTTPFTSPQP